jgi:hypothetical protein
VSQQQYKALFNAVIRARQSGKKVNIDDVLRDAELAQIAAGKHSNNGNGSEPERYCDCPELIIYGKRYPCPPGHDCNYAEARSALVFQAAENATERIGSPIGSAATGHKWTAEFIRQMDRLAFNAGLLR